MPTVTSHVASPISKGNQTMSDIKHGLRLYLLKIRDEIPCERRHEAKRCIMDELYPHLAPFKSILSFASFGSEIDLTELNQVLAKEGRLLLPRMENDQLIPHVVKQIASLKKSSWGILEPSKTSPTSHPDCILVPAIGFDRASHRIGYGKGHFDRFLQTVKNAITIGVGFKEQLTSDYLPTEGHDIPLSELQLF